MSRARTALAISSRSTRRTECPAASSASAMARAITRAKFEGAGCRPMRNQACPIRAANGQAISSPAGIESAPATVDSTSASVPRIVVIWLVRSSPCEVPFARRAKPLPDRHVGGDGLGCPRGERAPVLDDRQEQGLLGREIIVDGALGEPGPQRDLVVPKAGRREQAVGTSGAPASLAYHDLSRVSDKDMGGP